MKHLLAIAALFIALGSQAQLLKPEWSDVPWNEKNKRPSRTWGPYCHGNNAFMLGEMTYYKTDLIGYAWPEGERASARPVSIPAQKNHANMNGFTAFAGGPVVVYDEWDRKTGEVMLYAQRYDVTFAPDGPPVQLGTIPLDPKAYGGGELVVTLEKSDDGSKLLVVFDKIQMNNIKLAIIWVLDQDMELAWKGAYRLPVQAYNSTTSYYISDQGAVLARVNAVVLNEDNVKEKRDGSIQAKVDAKTWKHSTTSWFRLHGEVFQMWDGETSGTEASDGKPIWINDDLYFLTPTSKDEKANAKSLFTPELVLVGMDKSFAPQLLAKRSMGKEVSQMGIADVHVASANSITVLWSHPDGLLLQEMDDALNLNWELQLPKIGSVSLLKQQDAILVGGIADKKQLEVLMASGSWVGSKEGTKDNDPVVFSIEQGATQFSVQRLAPPNPPKDFNAYASGIDTFQKCPCYVRKSHSKQPPGMMRTIVDQ